MVTEPSVAVVVAVVVVEPSADVDVLAVVVEPSAFVVVEVEVEVELELDELELLDELLESLSLVLELFARPTEQVAAERQATIASAAYFFSFMCVYLHLKYGASHETPAQ